ncbi:MAG: polyprenyl synthetase family protein [Acidimicrobiia bacterium]
MSSVPATLPVIADRVERRLRVLVDAERQRWASVDSGLEAPIDALSTLLFSRAKRLRPAFCHWGFVGAGGDPDDPCIVDTGAAFELLHAFALMHDDVMDGSATRRGVRTAHLVFSDHHSEGRWLGESRRFGEGVAILIGDLAFVYADQLMTGAPDAALELWHELRVELNIGQYLDLLGTARSDRDPSSAARIARYKSGKYTVERPLHLGAALAAPDRVGELIEPLSRYGLPLGDAFQLRDDLLGAFGDATLTGKPVGDDLREGKPTLLLAMATARASHGDLKLLGRVGAPDLGPDEIRGIQGVLEATGAKAELEARIDELVNEAVKALDRVALVPAAIAALTELAGYIARRDT